MPVACDKARKGAVDGAPVEAHTHAVDAVSHWEDGRAGVEQDPSE